VRGASLETALKLGLPLLPTRAQHLPNNSSDSVTAQEHIGYYLYLNGQFDGATIHPYRRQFSMYLTPGIVNTIEVYAVDEAGNRSTTAGPVDCQHM
jgi:hypothetical protein